MSESTQYRFRVTQSDDVEVTSEGEIVELQLRSVSPLPVIVSPKEWIATDRSGQTRSVRRTRRFPVPQFVIAKGSETLATIQCTHLLRTRYVISLTGGATWVFRIPLFRAYHSGSSIQGHSLFVKEWRKNLWDLFVDVDQSSLEMLTAIACIFLARWRST
ncbi:MAG TPA: hypothetical protein VGD61_23775 [Pyrinomonadaceae bacterium]